ncbi:CXXC-20-CXXC protein [Planomicrobium soli]|uniref:CXXC-20-CXXC protein n=1 Tax=Planomicrobium soli TaxID=1176648 RepID=A0A2P8H5W9_9BACL|nr:CXXC-20-CXXC protein [Planomicrobium soli]
MPICQNCGHTWSWRTTFKKSFTFSTGMTCPACGATQYQTVKSRRQTSLLSVIIAPSIILSSHYFSLSFKSLIMLGLPLTIGIVAILPFLYKFSNEEKPLW